MYGKSKSFLKFRACSFRYVEKCLDVANLAYLINAGKSAMRATVLSAPLPPW